MKCWFSFVNWLYYDYYNICYGINVPVCMQVRDIFVKLSSRDLQTITVSATLPPEVLKACCLVYVELTTDCIMYSMLLFLHILSSQNFLIYFPYLLLYRSQTSSCTTQYASWWSRRRSLWKESSSFMLMLREKSISLTHSVTSMRLCGLIGNIAYRQWKLKVGVACMHACTNDRRCIA